MTECLNTSSNKDNQQDLLGLGESLHDIAKKGADSETLNNSLNALLNICSSDPWYRISCMPQVSALSLFHYAPQIVYRVTAYRVDSGYRVGFSWNQFILAISIVRIVLL